MKPKSISFTAFLSSLDPRRSWTGYLFAAGITLATGIALLSPEVTAGLGLFDRLVFWFVNVGAALAILEGVQLMLGNASFAHRLSPLLQVLLAGAIGALLFAAFSVLFLEGLQGATEMEPEEVLSLLGFLAELRDSAGQTMLFWVLLNGPRLIMMAQDHDDRGGEATAVAHVPQDVAVETPGTPRSTNDPALVEFIARLPRRLGADIVAMTAELHYLRVYTRHGDALILMSFGRAVEALQIIDGIVVHRSHWVALNHVVRLETDGDKVLCWLDTGLSVPVSRSSRARLRQTLAERDRRLAERTVSAIARDLVRT